MNKKTSAEYQRRDRNYNLYREAKSQCQSQISKFYAIEARFGD